MTFTEEEIEQCFKDARGSAALSEWTPAYTFGYGQGIVAVMVAFDDLRRQKRESEIK